ncbi:MAG TPA: MerR family transcriptional regulator [Streptosporangiaceae bacterium]|nr:MerR family transcriptional regulator [Streptosporangiaceae bacterium]
MGEETASAMVRIGELGRRVGVSEHVLRAWERRYGLLRPERSPGGYRLYTDADEHRVRRMQAHLAAGLSAAEAAQVALSEERSTPPTLAGIESADGGLAGLAQDLTHSLDRLDEPGAQASLDRLLAAFTLETVLRDALLPYLHDLGDRWESGQVSIAGEHFASNLLRGRLAGLARGWGYGNGPQAVLACPPGEQHDLPLLMFGIVLHRCGWRVEYLGASTPVAELALTALESRADVVVVAATVKEHFSTLTDDLAQLARQVPLALAGAGATQALTDATGARQLPGDPVTEAQRLLPPPEGADRRQPGVQWRRRGAAADPSEGPLAAAAQERGSPGARDSGAR